MFGSNPSLLMNGDCLSLSSIFPVIVTEVTVNLCSKEFLFLIPTYSYLQLLSLDGYYHTLRRCMVANIFATMNSFFFTT